MKRLSVLSVAYPLAPVAPDTSGGAEQVLALLDGELVRQGHRSVVVACAGSRVEGELIPTPRPPGELDDAARVRAHREHRQAIRAALIRTDFDLVHMHGIDFQSYLPPPGPTVLVTLHLPPSKYPAPAFGIGRPNTHLVCVSGSQERTCPRSDLLLPFIPNGVDLARLETHVRKRCYAVALGRICPEKGFHDALDAARAARMPIALAGEVFPYRDHIAYFEKELRPRLDGRGARFLGAVGPERKRRLLAGARCLLVPSRAPETSSLVSMEAMACGTPVIAYPSGALAEIVEHGRTGFLVKDVHEMAAAIRKVNELDLEECRRAAHERFSSASMVRRYFALYASLGRGAICATGATHA